LDAGRGQLGSTARRAGRTISEVGEQFIVRAAAPADLEPVAAICAHYVTTTVTTFEEIPPTAADWQRRLDDLACRNLPFLVADQDDTVCGYAYASPWRPKPAYRYTVEDTVYVSPAHTGRGLGRALLSALLAGCEQAGCRQVIATSRASCTGGWASRQRAACIGPATSTGSGSTPC
jgi:L-amino acid N-acyltransferase YncA